MSKCLRERYVQAAASVVEEGVKLAILGYVTQSVVEHVKH
jgi:hypothetical protein